MSADVIPFPDLDRVRGQLLAVDAGGLVVLTDDGRKRVAVPHPEGFAGREGDEVEVRGVVTPAEET